MRMGGRTHTEPRCPAPPPGAGVLEPRFWSPGPGFRFCAVAVPVVPGQPPAPATQGSGSAWESPSGDTASRLRATVTGTPTARPMPGLQHGPAAALPGRRGVRVTAGLPALRERLPAGDQERGRGQQGDSGHRRHQPPPGAPQPPAAGAAHPEPREGGLLLRCARRLPPRGEELELFGLLPLHLVRLSIHDEHRHRLKVRLASGRTFYLQLLAPPGQLERVFGQWVLLLYRLRYGR
ncbi:Golgi-associated RAB2 interactor protein 5A [Pelodiscus sinensis]|uniref:Golgi-associated RAB2 interactor protein 5A n=1 Tax=Pelodiscus sinensis TaxID=13735 RepID=UPI003F6AB9CF